MSIKGMVAGGLAALVLGGCASSPVKRAVKNISSYDITLTSLIPTEATLISEEYNSKATPKHDIHRYDTNGDKKIDAVEIAINGVYSYREYEFIRFPRSEIVEGTAIFEKYLLLDIDGDEVADLMYIDRKSTWRARPRGHDWADGVYEKVVDLYILNSVLSEEMRGDEPSWSFIIEPIKMDKLKLLHIPLL